MGATVIRHGYSRLYCGIPRRSRVDRIFTRSHHVPRMFGCGA